MVKERTTVQPYVVRQGDYLLALAHQFGFDADTVWNDPSNAQLQQLRSNPNILFPGDLLRIPEPPTGEPPATNLPPGSTNNFVSDAPPVTISVKFVASDRTALASAAYEVSELPDLPALQTDPGGLASFSIPATLKSVTVNFTATGASFVLQIASIDPITTLSGVFARLQNLGFLPTTVKFDSTNLDVLRVGLRFLKDQQEPGSPPSPPPPPASAPPSSDSAAAGSAPDGDSSGPASSVDDHAPVGGSLQMQRMALVNAPPSSEPSEEADSAPASTPGESSAPPSAPAPNSAPASASVPSSAPAVESAPASAPPSEAGTGASAASDDFSTGADPPTDNAGLADDGTLDADTATLLVAAHGC